jgi:predicted unusual protein kinase regulating ubiquinone biosynthesis (AarF/ABC1/UbiB family)
VSALSQKQKQSSPYPSVSLPQGTIKPIENAQKNYQWNRKNYSRTKRRIDIWQFVLSFIYKMWLNDKPWSYKLEGGYSEEKLLARRKKQAKWIRENLLELGPTFIKVGQLFSTRADIFPAEYVEELAKLQDQVPAFSYEQTVEIIEEELGKPVNKLFCSFDPSPLAAASLGQVHKAKLYNGDEVVVKVQRPGLKQLFTIDLAILKQITYYFQNHPRWGKGRDWIGIYEECYRILWEETDYLNEGKNADTFRRNFRSENWVKVPRVYWRYTCGKVLTLEYVPGIKITHYAALEAAGLDRKELAQLGAKAYLIQLLNDGFFHADPHPGNLAVSPQGALIFYDFGMMGQIKANVKEKLLSTLMGITQKNADLIIKSLIDLGALQPIGDMGAIRRSIQFMLDNFMDKPFEEQSINAISDDLYDIAYDQPFRFPATFTFVMRAFSTLEGVGKGLDPNFNFMETAQPFALQFMNGNNGSGNLIFDELGKQALQVGSTAFGLPQRIEQTLDQLERGDIRIRTKASETDRLIRRMSLLQQGTNYTIMLCTLVICATLLFINKITPLAIVILVLGLLPGLSLFRLMRRINRLDRMERMF